ncbi:hypothetical protein ACVDG8_029495 [Mesorhizobium sp. ORM8.1]
MIIHYLIDNVGPPSISMSEASRAMRIALPLGELTDWELCDLIARSAIDAVFAIEFDGAGS